jgi:hypothetical protein
MQRTGPIHLKLVVTMDFWGEGTFVAGWREDRDGVSG